MKTEIAHKDVQPEVSPDLRGVLARAASKGGIFQKISEERLRPALALIDAVKTQLDRARDIMRPLEEQARAGALHTHAVLDKVSEELWSAVGRPASDAALSLLFPGGPGYYAEGSADEQPDRMELLAELLEAGVHPKLAISVARAAAGEVRAAAKSMRVLVDASRIPRARVRLLERATEVVARSAEGELALFGRRLRAEGVPEAEINAVIKGDKAAQADERAIPEGGLKLA